MRGAAPQAVPAAPSISAPVVLRAPGVRPHGEVRYRNGRAGVRRGADDVERRALDSVGAVSFPVVEGDSGVEDSFAGDGAHGGPVGVEVEGVGVVVADEVVECDVGDGAVAAVGFEHEHLVGVGGVDVAVFDAGDVWGCVSGRGEISKNKGKRLPVFEPREPMAQPPLQLQYTFSMSM